MKDVKKDFRILFVYPSLMLQTTFPMAIALFSSILKRNGFKVDVFDTTFYKTEDISSDERRVENLQIAKFQFDKSFTEIPSKETMCEDLAEKVKEFKPNLIAYSILEDLLPLSKELLLTTAPFCIPTIAGGMFPTFAPEKVLELPGVDMVCVGEGEELMLELCAAMRDGTDYSTIQNLICKGHSSGDGYFIRPPRNMDLNPPPDFSLFDDRRFYRPMKGKMFRMGLVETNRGCIYSCAYCNSHAQDELYKKNAGLPYFRTRDIGKIHDEIKILTDKYKIDFLYFPAEVFFSAPMDYNRKFAKMYKKFQLPFFCQNRAEAINEETVALLAEMNCHGCAIGIEHGNEEFRRKMLNRNVKNDTYLKALRLMEKTNIKVSVNNIIGFPDETRDLVFDTIELNRHFNVYQINAYFFSPYHGTPLRDLCIKRGYISPDAQTSYITKESILDMPQLSRSEITGLVRTFNLYVRFPHDRYQEIAVAEKLDERGNKMFKSLKNEYWKKYLK
jgi:radical SAM superfamily enzyme YgiQ (UPF0313 family)